MQSPTTTNLHVPWYAIRPAIEQVEEVTLDIPRARPRMLHHVSSDGGPIAALNRYILASKDEELGGMSFIPPLSQEEGSGSFDCENTKREKNCDGVESIVEGL